MAEPKINVPITTTADTSGITRTTSAVKEATAAMNPWITASRNVVATQRDAARALDSVERELQQTTQAKRQDTVATRQATEETKRATQATKELEAAATRAGGKKGTAGMGMLHLGQAIEDAQYGLRGVLNNIPLLVTSFGMSAGAAGVLQIGLVAVSQILNIVSTQAKENAGKPLLGEMTIDEKVVEHMRQFTELMERQRDAAKARNEHLHATAAAVNAAMKAERELMEFRRQVEDEDFVSTGDPIKDIAIKRDRALARVDEDAAMRERERAAALAKARGEQGNRDATAQSLAADAAKQKALVDGAKSRDLKWAEFQRLLAEQKRDSDQLGATSGTGFWNDLFGQFSEGGTLPSKEKMDQFFRDFLGSKGAGIDMKSAQIAKAVRERQERINNVHKELSGLPILPGLTATGDTEADEKRRREIFAQEVDKQRQLEKARDEAMREAEAGRRGLATTEASTAADAGLDDMKTERSKELINRNAESATQRQFAEEQRLRDEDAKRRADEEKRQADLAAANKGLNNAGRATMDPMADGAMGLLSRSMNDGQGDTAKEMAVVQEYLAKLGSNREQNRAALLEAVRAMEALQTDGSQMQQKLTSALSALAQAVRSVGDASAATQAQLNDYIQSNRR